MFEQFSHVGIVVHDIGRSLTTWRDVFGLRVVDEREVPEEGVHTVLLSTGGPSGAETCVELIQPFDAEDRTNVFARRLSDQGEGVYHLAFRTPDGAEAARRLQQAGIRHLVLPPAAGEPRPRTFIPASGSIGVHTELLADG